MSERKCAYCGEFMSQIGNAGKTCQNTNCLTFCRSVWVPDQYQTYADRLGAEIKRLSNYLVEHFPTRTMTGDVAEDAICSIADLAAENEKLKKGLAISKREEKDLESMLEKVQDLLVSANNENAALRKRVEELEKNIEVEALKAELENMKEENATRERQGYAHAWPGSCFQEIADKIRDLKGAKP